MKANTKLKYKTALKFFTFFYLLLFSVSIQSQKMVAITIDDVPHVNTLKDYHNSGALLNKLDSLKIPITIFINEGFIYKSDSVAKNFKLLNEWSKKKYTTLGNHSFSHLKYSEIGINHFKREVEKGEAITQQLAVKYNKSLKYFRFPFNDLGKDSVQYEKAKQYLKIKGYVVTPFTIESSDWMYNAVYEYYLKKKNQKKAKEIGKAYVTKTLEYFEFFDSLAKKDYQRSIRHIYLCHDNKLNTDFLPELINELRSKNYTFISLENALTDKAYQQKNNYHKKWGISWLYRWQKSQKQRITNMKQEPSIKIISKQYQHILEND